MEKMTSRKQQAIASRKHILEIASQLTGEKGFDSVTIQDICTTAGVSVGAFYHYFSSKEEIILAWYGLSDEYFDTEVMPRLLRSDANILEKVADFAREQIGFGMQYGVEHIGQLYRAQIVHNSPDFYSSDRGLVGGMIKLLTEAQKSGELRPELSAEHIAYELLTIIRGIILDWIWGGTSDPKARASDMVKRYVGSYC